MSCEERRVFDDYVKLVEGCMNQAAGPGDNFLEYACGNFKIEDFDGKSRNRPPSMFGFKNIIKEIFEKAPISDPNFEKAKDFIKSKHICLEGGLKQHLKSDYFNEFCGGLPAFNENWHRFDWARTIGILYVFQCYTTFSLTLEHSDEIKEIFVELDHYTIHDFSHIDNILSTLELDDAKLEEIVNAVQVFKEDLPKDLGKKKFAFPGIELQNGNRMAYDIHELIETALSLKIKENDVVYLGEGVVSFVSFLDGLDRRLLANYLTFLLARSCFYRVEDTVDQIDYFMPVLISTGFETYFNDDEVYKRKYLKNRFNHSFTVVEDNFPDNIREEEETVFGRNDVEILKFMKMHYSLVTIGDEYEDLYINPSNFYQNLYSITIHGIPKSLKTFKSAQASDKCMNSLILALLKEAVIYSNKPMVFRFAGQELANWIYLIFKRIKNSPSVNAEERKKFMQILEARGELRGNLRRQADQIICSIEAIGHVFRDYKIWMSENEATVRWQNEILARINLDCIRIFFVAYAQHWICCEEPNKNVVHLTLTNFEDFSKSFICD